MFVVKKNPPTEKKGGFCLTKQSKVGILKFKMALMNRKIYAAPYNNKYQRTNVKPKNHTTFLLGNNVCSFTNITFSIEINKL